MKLATIRTTTGTRAARVEADGFVDLGAPDVDTLLTDAGWRHRALTTHGFLHTLDTELAPVVVNPGKIICVGLNYRNHILEMGRDLPKFPTLFAKFTESLIGPRDEIELPPESAAVDWEAELVVVLGATARRADDAAAAAAIAGFTVMNDISMRDWQFRTPEWLQGKTFENSTPLGPVLVTPDSLSGGIRPELSISASVNGEIMQKSNTSDLLFPPVDLVRYISTLITLRPGDVIATGTPGGVGHARKPPRYLAPGDHVVVEIDGIGRLENTARPA